MKEGRKMTLPTEKSKPKANLWEYPIFLYGRPKIGKSTLASEIEGNLFFNTGGGLDALEVFKIDITSWEGFIASKEEFLRGEHKFRVATIDTADRLHKLCANYIMQKRNIEHPQDLEFGKGYDMIKDAYIKPLTEFALSPYGLIMISHVREVEIKTRTAEITKSIPTLQNHVWELIDGITGIILFYDIKETEDGIKRVIRTKPNPSWIAGDRTKKLLSYNSGEIEVINGEPTWPKIERIFNGELKSTESGGKK